MIHATTCHECGLALEPGGQCPRCLLGAGLGEDAELLEGLVGLTIEGKYRVERLLGRGGMGAVYLATHLGTERPVALKVLAPDLTDEEEFVERFRREAKAAGRLRHPNTVNVTDFGVADLREDGELAYLVMEYLDGESLADHIARRRERSLTWVADVVGQIAAAVDEAHRHGVIHRDLKPGNIWLVPNGRGHTVKVLDFGLAKLRETDDAAVARPVASEDATPTLPMRDRPRRPGLWHSAARRTVTRAGATIPGAPPSEADGLTRVGSLLGTPHYMSPEQCRGEKLDERSDVYSLGVVAYELLTGRPPFSGDVSALLAQHLDDAPTPPSATRPSLSEGVDGPIMAALAKLPAGRPRTAGDLARSLELSLTALRENERSVFAAASRVYVENFGALIRLTLVSGIVPAAACVGLVMVVRTTVPPLEFLLGPFVVAAGFATGEFFTLRAIVPVVARATTTDRRASAFDPPRADLRRVATYLLTFLWPSDGTAMFVVGAFSVGFHAAAHRSLLYPLWMFGAVALAGLTGATDRALAGAAVLLEGASLSDAGARGDRLAKRLAAAGLPVMSTVERLVAILVMTVVVTVFAYAPAALGALNRAETETAAVGGMAALVLALLVNPILGVCVALKYVTARRLGGETVGTDAGLAPPRRESWWERAEGVAPAALDFERDGRRLLGLAGALGVFVVFGTLAAAELLPTDVGIELWWLVPGFAGLGAVAWSLYLLKVWRSTAGLYADDQGIARRSKRALTRIEWPHVTRVDDRSQVMTVYGTATGGTSAVIEIRLGALARPEEVRAYVAHQLRHFGRFL